MYSDLTASCLACLNLSPEQFEEHMKLAGCSFGNNVYDLYLTSGQIIKNVELKLCGKTRDKHDVIYVFHGIPESEHAGFKTYEIQACFITSVCTHVNNV